MKQDKQITPKHVQGLILAYELRGHKLTYKFMRLIPLARINLKDAAQMRLSSFPEYLKNCGESLLKTRYWLTFGLGCRGSEAPVYLIKTTKRNRRYFLKLKAGLHYRLRVGIHRWSDQYSDEDGENAVFDFYNKTTPDVAEVQKT